MGPMVPVLVGPVVPAWKEDTAYPRWCGEAGGIWC